MHVPTYSEFEFLINAFQSFFIQLLECNKKTV